MNRDDIFDEIGRLDDFGLSPDNYTIGFDAAMVIHGIKDECDHIDVVVSAKGVSQLRRIGYVPYEWDYVRNCKYVRLTDELWVSYREDIRRHHVQSNSIDGYKVFNPLSLWRELAYYSDPQLIADRELLAEWIERRNIERKYNYES